MPCNGVAVATGIINENLAKLALELPREALTQAIVTMLQSKFPETFKGKKAKAPPAWVQGFGFRLHGHIVTISKTGRVTTQNLTRSGASINKAINQAVSGLVAGLGSVQLQNNVVAKLKKAGYNVTNQKRAKNGAIVAQVEV